MKPSRWYKWAAAALLAVACQDPRPLTSPPSFLIQDAAHSGGNPHVYWLPPMERSEEHTSELQSQSNLVCRLLLEKKKKNKKTKERISYSHDSAQLLLL